MERFVAYWQATAQFLGAPGKPSKRKPVAKLMLCYRHVRTLHTAPFLGRAS